MNDRELLEMAAKAAGLKVKYTEPSLISGKVFQVFFHDDGYQADWHPLTDDGDALRLAVKLGITVFSPDCAEYHNGGDVCAAVRLAIVRAAAEIGKSRGVM